MKSLMMILLIPALAMAWDLPPGYEIVNIDGNRVEIKDLSTGYVTPYWTDFDADSINIPVIDEAEDDFPRQWYYFERLAVLPWYAAVVGADLNHSGVGEIYGWVGGTTYLDTITSGWNFEHISLGDYDGPRISGDTDNDGNFELLTHGNDYLTLLESDSYYSYPTNVIWSYYHGTNGERDPKLGNVDGDGLGEVLFYPFFHLTYEVYELDSSGSYNYTAGIRFGDYVNDYVGEPSFGDVDGDGYTEVFAGGIHGEVIVFENVADDSFEFVWQYQLAEPSAYSTEYLGDTDGDGSNEFMVAARDLFGGGGILFTIFESNGNNSYNVVYSKTLDNYQLQRGDIFIGDFIGTEPVEIALGSGKRINIISAESDNVWREKARFQNAPTNLDSDIYLYKRGVAERSVIVNSRRAPWETILLRIKGAFLPGDVNNNGVVSGNDVIYFVSYIKNGGDIDEPIIRADANGDCEINLLDATYLVNYFKGRVPVPEPGWCHFYVE